MKDEKALSDVKAIPENTLKDKKVTEKDKAEEAKKNAVEAFGTIKSAKNWAAYSAEDHFKFYNHIASEYNVKMFYDNGEKELFPPPSRDFVSVLECIVDLKKKEVNPELTGKLRINVLFDRETKKAKVDAFREFMEDKYKKTGLLSDSGLELNIRYCRREGHHVGTVKTKDKELEDFGYKKGVTDGTSLKNAVDGTPHVTLIYFCELD